MQEKFSPYGSPIPLVFVWKFHPDMLTGFTSGGVKQGRVGKTSHFLALNVSMSKMVRDMSKVTIND